jgi:hypothetical protein
LVSDIENRESQFVKGKTLNRKAYTTREMKVDIVNRKSRFANRRTLTLPSSFRVHSRPLADHGIRVHSRAFVVEVFPNVFRPFPLPQRPLCLSDPVTFEKVTVTFFVTFFSAAFPKKNAQKPQMLQ